MELELSHAIGASGGAGFWGGRRIFYPPLAPPPTEVTRSMVEGFGWSPAQIEAVNTIGRQRVERLAAPAHGYAGWLLTNPQFLREHDSLFQTWQSEISEQGIPVMGATRTPGLLPETVHQAEDRTAEWLTAFERILSSLAIDGPCSSTSTPAAAAPANGAKHVIGSWLHACWGVRLRLSRHLPNSDPRRAARYARRWAAEPRHRSTWPIGWKKFVPTMLPGTRSRDMLGYLTCSTICVSCTSGIPRLCIDAKAKSMRHLRHFFRCRLTRSPPIWPSLPSNSARIGF